MASFGMVIGFVIGVSVGHWFKNKRSRYLARELEKAIYFASSIKKKNEELLEEIKKNEELSKEIKKTEQVKMKNSVDEMRIGVHEAALAMSEEL